MPGVRGWKRTWDLWMRVTWRRRRAEQAAFLPGEKNRFEQGPQRGPCHEYTRTSVIKRTASTTRLFPRNAGHYKITRPSFTYETGMAITITTRVRRLLLLIQGEIKLMKQIKKLAVACAAATVL